MEHDKVIYTDGRDVTVTDSTLKVRNHAYKISGITRSTFWPIRPERWPASLLLLLGIGLAILRVDGCYTHNDRAGYKQWLCYR